MIPASCAGLDVETAYRALLRAHGNVSAAAARLDVPAPDFRLYVMAEPRVAEAALEAEEAALDQAEHMVREAMRLGDMGAAALVLRTNPAAWRRGWRSSGPQLKLKDDV